MSTTAEKLKHLEAMSDDKLILASLALLLGNFSGTNQSCQLFAEVLATRAGIELVRPGDWT